MSTTPLEKIGSQDRLVTLSDGVFAIAMTLLVLDIRLPDSTTTHSFQSALVSLVPKFISYVISFIMIATYWSVHRRIMQYVNAIDALFIRFNLLVLFFVAVLPLPTTFAIQQQGYSDPYKLSTIIYTLSLAFTGLSLAALWWHATRKHRLVDPTLENDVIAYFLLRSLISPGFFLLSLLLLLLPIDPTYVYFSWWLIFVIYVILRRLQPRLFPKAFEDAEHQVPSDQGELPSPHRS